MPPGSDHFDGRRFFNPTGPRHAAVHLPATHAAGALESSGRPELMIRRRRYRRGTPPAPW